MKENASAEAEDGKAERLRFAFAASRSWKLYGVDDDVTYLFSQIMRRTRWWSGVYRWVGEPV